MAECMLTTVDNPFNPFKNYDEWLRFDLDHGYNSSSVLARIAKTSSQLSDEENDQEIERAIDVIVGLDFLNVFKKIVNDKDSFVEKT